MLKETSKKVTATASLKQGKVWKHAQAVVIFKSGN